MNRGQYQRLSADQLEIKHRQIVELKQQGISLTKIAKQVNASYGSVLYVIYRKPDNGLWMNASSVYKCSKCKGRIEDNRSGIYRYCLSCHNRYMRENRPKHSELSEYQRLKSNCRSYLNVYIKRGKILKLPCSVCGDKKSEAHHSDYSKPLEVVWFCRKHHNEIHKKNPFLHVEPPPAS